MGSNLAGTQCLDSLDFVLQGGAIDDEQLRITPPEDCFDVNFDFISPPVPRTMPDFGIYEFGSEATSGSLEPGPFMPIEHAATSNPAAEKPNPGALVHVSSMQQESVEQMSALNVEIHRQLSVVSQVAKEYATTEPSLMDSTDQRNRLSSAVVSMIQGLQTFQTLLLEILGAARQGSPKEPASRASMHSSQKNDTSLQTSWTWLNTKNDLSSIADADTGDTISDFETGDRQTISRSDTNSEVRPIPESPSQTTWLDMSTSLLIISCYINLIQLCRDVFAAIRGALSVPGHQTTLLELSGFQISGVSIHEDSDLQIIVLTQVVVRLIDRIGLYLGYSGTSTAEAGKRDESDFNCKTISPQLLDFVLGQKEMEGQPSCKERIEALREEIRKLSEVVYKPI
uniref:Transcription factor xenB n=1 Tax=Xenoacremonium sinensis TaxID=2480843 RepID=XENB_XENSI|nr:RecName: Full=Transcription factor xenB; AltName: Full=Xenoacremones biosynthesis cluster protein B [Xenoacremonium sp. BF-2018a]QOJ72660.1 XenB [Xenoacremonium sp. BF-2018a]